MKDLIYRQDAIDALDVNDRFADARYPEWYVDVIEQVPSAQQWIPTSERLPEKDGFYLISIPPGEFPDGFLQVDMIVFLDGKWQYQYDFKKKQFQEFNCPVLAWMPLPKPYEEDCDE